ncbi:glycosyl transferase [Lipomyces japonicus]|uniref:glycosyl transferase n=1 Tax=Lipomyces japonicus TaxID=56871 RepID=UPI0034CD6191
MTDSTILETDTKCHTEKDSVVANVAASGSNPAAAAANAKSTTNDCDDYPLNVFLSAFKAPRTQWVARRVIVMIAMLFRLGVGLGPYSGMHTAPMYGDFEAQRHWMEITKHLPISQWYWYDLSYWGLDYPPLTAYHSWLLGYFGGSRLLGNPSWFALDSSRGFEHEDLKSFMRLTVIASDLIVYVPAVTMMIRWKIKFGKPPSSSAALHHSIAAAAVLLQPALVVIDHGHFQYNGVMIGLAVLALANILADRLVLGAAFFVLALSFKQMALYYALPVFAYLLGLCVFPRPNLPRFFALAVTVVVTFAVVWGPIVFSSSFSSPPPSSWTTWRDQLRQVIVRIFPFERGMWEDKVANVWCAANVVIKLRQRFTGPALQRLSLAATLAASAPACVIAFLRPRKAVLIWAVTATAWAFFLFSFQVHEKTVLVPLVLVTLQLADQGGRDQQAVIYWVNNVAVFSLWPLIRRDGLQLQATVAGFLWNWLMGVCHCSKQLPSVWPARWFVVGSYVLMAAWIVAQQAWPVPVPRLPDLWVVVNLTASCACFIGFLAWNYVQLWRIAFGINE